MSDIEDFLDEDARQARAAVSLGMDADADQTAKALKVSRSFGLPMGAVEGEDQDDSIKQLRGKVAGDLVSQNPHLQNYVASHRHAASVSNDDWVNLDELSEAMDKAHGTTAPLEVPPETPPDSDAEDLTAMMGVPGAHLSKALSTAAGKGVAAFVRDFDAQKLDVDAAVTNQWLRSLLPNSAIWQAYMTYSLTGQVGYLPNALPSAFSGLMGGAATAAGSFIHSMGLDEEDRARGEIYDLLQASQAYLPRVEKIPLGKVGEIRRGVRQDVTITPWTALKEIVPHANREIGAAAPWVRAGKDPPYGAGLILDEDKKLQSELDAKNLSEAMQKAMATATRERSTEMFQQFLQDWPDAKIEIPAEKVRELIYKDRIPSPDDGLLGWVPGIAEKLGAEEWNGDVEIPVADWYAKVEPDVYRALKDHIRVRPHGLTPEEAKVLPTTTNTPTDIADQVRQIAGLDPLLQRIDERKLTLQKVDELPGRWSLLGGKAPSYHVYEFLNENGESVGGATIGLTKDGKTLSIEDIAGEKGYGPADFGPKMVMDMLRQLRQEFPNAKELIGYRVSGAREAAGLPLDLEHRKVVIDLDKTKFNKNGYPVGWDTVDPLHEALTGGNWETISSGIDAYIKPYEAWTEEEKDIAHLAMQEMRRILGDKPHVDYTVTKGLRVGGEQTWGVFQMYRDAAPTIIASLESPDTIKTMRHEAIHFLRQMGLWKPEEWATLERAATAGKWIEKHDIDRRYPTLTHEGRLEEAIAEEFGYWLNGQKGETHESLHPIFEKLRDMLARLGKRLKEFLGRESGFEDLFLAADIGEIGKREIKPLREDVWRPGTEGEVAKEPIEPQAQKAGPKEPEPELKPPFLKKPPGMTQERYNKIMQAIENQRLTEAQNKEENLRKKEARRQTVEWKDRRKDMRQDVASEMEARPEHLADKLLREGTLFGAKVTPLPKLLREAVPEGYRDVLSKYIADEGIHPDDLAGLFGLRTGDELVDRLANLNHDRATAGMEPKDYLKRLVDSETDRRMEVKYGDLEDNINTAIDDMLSDSTLMYIHEENIYLAEKAGQQVPLDPKAIIAQYGAAMRRLSLPQISAQKMLESSYKAAKLAEGAMLKGDWLTAFKYGQMREKAALMAKLARDMEKEVAKFNREASINSRRSRESVDQTYLNFVHQIYLKVGKGIRRSVQDLENEIANGNYPDLKSFVDAKRAQQLEIEMPEFLYDPNFSTNMKKMTGEQFTQISEAVTTMLTNGRMERKLDLVRGAEDLAAAKEAVLKLTADLKPVKLTGIGSGVRKLGRNALASSLQMEDIMERLERGQYGPLTQTIRELIDAVNVKEKMEKEAATAMGKLAKPKSLKRSIDNPLFREPPTTADSQVLGPLMSFTRKNLIAIMLNLGNEGNIAKLAKGYGIDDPGAIKAWVDKYATKEDWDFVQGVWDIFEGLKGKSDVMYRKLSGIAPTSIEISPVLTKWGEYKGGYYPLIHHEYWEGLKEGEKPPPPGALGANYVKATVPRGYTKERTGATYPLSLELDGMIGRMAQEINDIAIRPAWINANKLLGSAEIKNEITRKLGPEFKNLIDPFLRDVAGVQNYRSDLAKLGAKWSEFFRQNVITSLVGLNPSTVVKHGTTAAINSLTEVGPINFLKATRQLLAGDPAIGDSVLRFALDNSVELQRRFRNYFETLGGATNITLGEKWWHYTSLRETMMKMGSSPVAVVDMMSAVPTWLAAYEKAKNAYPEDLGRAISDADRAVRRAHGSTAITSRAAIARQGPLMAWFTSLYGFFSHILNRQWEMTWRAREAAGLVKKGEYKASAKEFSRVGVMFFSYVIAPALVEELVSGGGDPDEGYGHKAARVLGRGLASSWAGLRDVASALEYGKDPSLGIMGTGLHMAHNVYRDLGKEEPFNEEHMGKLVQDGFTVFGGMFGLMHAQEGKIGRYLYDVKAGNVDPEGFGDWRYGLWHGVPRKEE